MGVTIYANSIAHPLQALSSLPGIKFTRRSKPAPSKQAVTKAGDSNLAAGRVANTTWKLLKGASWSG